jgi:heptaprenyl diphosphate synthase
MVKSKSISYISILTAMASAIYYVETFLPLPVGVPGARWGFSNFTIIISVIENMGFVNIMMIALLKTVIGSILSGKFLAPTFYLGLSGALASALMMYLMNKIFKKLSILGISEIGAFFSNTAQIIVAGVFIVKSKGIVYYYPYMILFGALTAFINAYVVKIVKRSVKFDNN